MPDELVLPWSSLDFRFLLPSPEPGLIFVDSIDDLTASMLRSAGAAISHDPAAGHDVALTTPRTPVRPRVAPNGVLVASGVAVGRVDGQVRRYWGLPWPDPVRLVPLDDVAARRWLGVDRRPAKKLAARLAGPLAGLLTRSTVTVVREHGAVDSWIHRRLMEGSPEVRGSVLLTPRFPTSRHVVALGLDATGSACLVAKAARRPGDDQRLRHEHDMLALLERLAPSVDAPRAQALEQHGGTAVLLQSALRGRSLPGALAGLGQARAAAMIADLAGRLPVTEATADPQLALSLLDRLDDLVDGSPEVATLVASTRRLAEHAGALPHVLEHGDLAHHNVVLTPDGALGALDWETGRRHGLPGHDLAFAIEYLSAERSGAVSHQARCDAYAEAVLPQGAWGRVLLEQQLASRGVDPDALPTILAVSWARRAVALAERSGTSVGVLDHRDGRIWRRMTTYAEGRADR